MTGCGFVDRLDPVAVLHSVLISSVVHNELFGLMTMSLSDLLLLVVMKQRVCIKFRHKIGKLLRNLKGKVHPCAGTEALYRPYGP
jgi:hypothetical protein